MSDYTLGTIEGKFAKLIWDNEPISSGDLVKLCEKELGWKKSTTYTVLKRLCLREIFQNTDGCVTSLISEKDFYSLQSEEFIDETFNGSLPRFLAAFTRRKKLSDKEIEELKKLIDENRR